jgi:regulator of RNase E activity RraA
MNPILDPLLRRCAALDTAALSDALDSLGIAGGLPGLHQQVPGTRCCGYAYTVQYQTASGHQGFRGAADYIDAVPPDAVIVACNDGRLDATVWGDILTRFAHQRGINGTFIDGVARDLDSIAELAYPLFSRGRFMQSGKNRVQLAAVQVPVRIGSVAIAPGDVMVADASGCLAIPRAHLEAVLARAEAVERNERAIITAVRAGQTLQEARRLHRYDQPWHAAESEPTPQGAAQ